MAFHTVPTPALPLTANPPGRVSSPRPRSSARPQGPPVLPSSTRPTVTRCLQGPCPPPAETPLCPGIRKDIWRRGRFDPAGEGPRSHPRASVGNALAHTHTLSAPLHTGVSHLQAVTGPQCGTEHRLGRDLGSAPWTLSPGTRTDRAGWPRPELRHFVKLTSPQPEPRGPGARDWCFLHGLYLLLYIFRERTDVTKQPARVSTQLHGCAASTAVATIKEIKFHHHKHTCAHRGRAPAPPTEPPSRALRGVAGRA